MHTTPITTPILSSDRRRTPLPPTGTPRLDDPRRELQYGGAQAAILVAVAGSAALTAGGGIASTGFIRTGIDLGVSATRSGAVTFAVALLT